MKAYTDIKQSKKLAEILPIESADMGWYYSCNPRAASNQMWVGTKSENADIPCWSLSALLDNIPQVKLDRVLYNLMKNYGDVYPISNQNGTNPFGVTILLMLATK